MGSSRKWMRRLFASLRSRRSREGFGLALLLTVAIVAGGGALAGGAPEAGAREGYSPYSDPEKPALSHVLSDRRNVAEFQEQFGLSDGEVEAVLFAVREENEGLSRAQGESRRVIESSGELPDEQVRGKIKASEYDEQVEEAVARTKTTVERALPPNRRPELKTWVDGKWQQERQKVRERSATNRAAAARGKRTFEVFATQYEGYTKYEVALPHKGLKFDGGYEVNLSLGNRSASAPVKEVGPWNLKDNWWDKSRYRTKWNDLPRGLPEAEAAFYDNYNKGRDGFGRKVLNPAGVDLTPAVAKKLGLSKYENAWIRVSYPRR